MVSKERKERRNISRYNKKVDTKTMGKRWTQDEIDFLKNNYSLKTNKELEKEINRSFKQIQGMAVKLQLKKSKEAMFKRVNGWKDNEIEILNKYYPNTPNEKIYELLPNKTNRSINSKANRLGLNKNYVPASLRRINLDNNKIKQLRDSGMTCRQIANELGCSKELVSKRYMEMGIKSNHPNIKLNLNNDKIKDLYNTGKSLTEISIIFNCSPESIKLRLINMGVKIRNRGEERLLPKSDQENIIRLYLEGNSTYDIEKKTGICYLRVFNTLKRNGIILRNKEEAMKSNWKKRDYNNQPNVVIQNKIIKEEYLKGTPIAKIKEMVGFKEEKTVTSRLKKMKVDLNRIHDRGERKKILCACGCGQELWNFDNQKRFRKYIIRHNNRLPMIELRKHSKEIIDLYQQGHSTAQIGKMFKINAGPINRLLKESKIDLMNVSSFGKVCKADDSHIVKSGVELYIDNWLFHNDIFHIYEKKIGFRNLKCDFYLNKLNLYIEYFGMPNHKDYRERMIKKLEAYRTLGLNLLAIFPKDNIDEKLNLILKQIKELNYDKGYSQIK